MKKMNKVNSRGFTLIELLAVIVILAIVMVLASTTVLPFMRNASKDAFVLEANGLIDAASNTISLMSIGSIEKPTSASKDYKKNGENYCFSLDWLVGKGTFDLDKKSLKSDSGGKGTYEGYVTAVKSGTAYTYTVYLRNDEFEVTGITNTAERADAKDATTTAFNDCTKLALGS